MNQKKMPPIKHAYVQSHVKRRDFTVLHPYNYKNDFLTGILKYELILFTLSYFIACFMNFICYIFCFRPHDTPFEDGTFKLTVEFTEEYPNKPPTVRFVSKMFHPNGKCVFSSNILRMM